MSRKTLDGPAGMIGGAYLPSAALLHEATLCSVAAPTYHLPAPQWDERIFDLAFLIFAF